MKALFQRLRWAVLSLVALVLALIPTWMFVWVRSFASPDGFWQELALGVAGVYVAGGDPVRAVHCLARVPGVHVGQYRGRYSSYTKKKSE
ncbi:hypothetical protein A2348_03805 [Candidatus Uhrbacteria bacterium RIFOXYB12_FULL_58_10]|uniref:Uncharacterized protein n=1 Tax=Candidatus Uhrbacteria bacterium RIFOXYB2_FULL_57_15 TaxID=1802422 RepID=A0A1F7W633_9BACT|nr:MAG: hypothetical protein A2348_03805 [Candidatus Uhrbacteria bacterium RIFOXYB12_FULL_58_10]OGL98076.1 MAG: hypothetical protein A2304_00955 [Candidatus Uhrbacteria bacterium RIFOXYB2_FULL_57_15]OGL99581.1 MAG: hypothetical protein A2501_00010 [Candidatus Uhrbacteria bacterium RIFOXYC12_FULL_57_11]